MNDTCLGTKWGVKESVKPADRCGVTRCPQCSAAARPDALWCSLCHFSLQSVPEPAAVTVPAPAPVVPAESIPAPASELPVSDLGVSDLAVSDLTVPDLTVPESWVDEVAQESSVAEPEFDLSLLGGDPFNPALGGLASKVSSNSGKAAVVIGGTVAVSVVFFALMSLIGLFLR